MSKFMKRIFSVMLAFALVLQLTGGEAVVAKSQKKMKKTSINVMDILNNRERPKAKGYLITTKKKTWSHVKKKTSMKGLKYGKKRNKIGYVNTLDKKTKSKIKKDKNVVAVEKDYIMQGSSFGVQTASEETAGDEWNMNMIHSGESTQVETNSKVKVAIIDSGIDVTEEVNVVKRINLVPGEEERLPLFEDFLGHGTSVAGIIASKGTETSIEGVNPNVEIYSAKVLDDMNCAPVSRVIEAIYWAIDNDVDVINMSFGMSNSSKALYEAIKEAYNKGITMVASAGNGSVLEYPAAYSEVVAVGSVDSQGNVVSPINSSDIDVVAPGELVKSLGAFGGELVSSGTSMAAPHVTGIVSRILQSYPEATPGFIKGLLRETANQTINQIGSGCGLVDMERALSSLEDYKEKYVEKENVMIPENTRSVVTDDNDYVEGRWKLENHYTLGTQYNYITNSQYDIKLVKIGEMLPDLFLKTKDDERNTAFHGFGDYIAYATCLYQFAWGGMDQQAINFWGSTEAEHAKCTYMRSKLDGFFESQDFYAFLHDPNNRNCDLYPTVDSDGDGNPKNDYVYNMDLTYANALDTYDKQMLTLGIAIHSATDSIAHNSCYKSGSQWVRFSSTNADRIDLYPKRWSAAAQIAKMMTIKYAGRQMMTCSTYALSSTYYDGSFKMLKLLHYANKCGAGDLSDTLYSRLASNSISEWITE